MLIPKNATLLFQGDSVTDCGRKREEISSMGGGYPNFVSSLISAKYPELNIKFVNKGISGNKTRDLVSRWQEDCIDLKPDFLSILIGINDCWHGFNHDDKTTAEQFEDNYREILTRTKKELPNTKIIIMEPFVLPYPQDRLTWRVVLDPEIHIARKLAREFDALLIPLDGIFAKATMYREPTFWAADGVHPTGVGHALIAQSFIDLIEK